MHLRADKEVLRRTPLFRRLDEQELAALAVCLRVRVCDAGAWLFRQGDPGASMLLVAEGAFAATVRERSAEEREIHRMGPGEVIGEMAFLDAAPRSASVRAITSATYYELDRDGLEILRAHSPSAAAAVTWAVIRDVTRRLRRMDALIEVELERAGVLE